MSIRDWASSLKKSRLSAPTASRALEEQGDLRDSALELAKGCDVDYIDTIPAEFEELLAFSETSKR